MSVKINLLSEVYFPVLWDCKRIKITCYKYTNKLLPSAFENVFKKLGNIERSLNYLVLYTQIHVFEQ